MFLQGKLSKEDCFNLLTSIEFFEKEFLKLDSRTMAILKSEITRITGCFVSDFQVQKIFCPKKEEINEARSHCGNFNYEIETDVDACAKPN